MYAHTITIQDRFNENLIMKCNNRCVKILVVEDEIKLAEHLKNGLGQEGYCVEVYTDGEEAQRYILDNHELLDLILLDEVLPLKSGSDIVKTLRSNNIETPILMLTAKDTPQDMVRCLDAGADDYLTKPFSFAVLLASIRALLRRQKSRHYTGEQLQIGNLMLNTSSRKALYNDRELKLTMKEFNLLEYMMKHADEVLNRERILEKIWDINFNSFSNVVDVHVTYLRKKLKEAGSGEILETVRGVGYKLKK